MDQSIPVRPFGLISALKKEKYHRLSGPGNLLGPHLHNRDIHASKTLQLRSLPGRPRFMCPEASKRAAEHLSVILIKFGYLIHTFDEIPLNYSPWLIADTAFRKKTADLFRWLTSRQQSLSNTRQILLLPKQRNTFSACSKYSPLHSRSPQRVTPVLTAPQSFMRNIRRPNGTISIPISAGASRSTVKVAETPSRESCSAF